MNSLFDDSAFGEAEQCYLLAKTNWEHLSEEFEAQKNDFFVRAQGDSYFENIDTIEFVGGELNKEKALEQCKEPRRIQRQDLVDGIKRARQVNITDRLERMSEAKRRLREIQELSTLRPRLGDSLVVEYGRLMVEVGNDNRDFFQIQSELHRKENEFIEQIRSFDDESQKMIEHWQTEIDYLVNQYAVCCELKTHVENALQERDRAQEQLLDHTFYTTPTE